MGLKVRKEILEAEADQLETEVGALKRKQLRDLLDTAMTIRPADDKAWQEMLIRHQGAHAWPHLTPEDIQGAKDLWDGVKGKPEGRLALSRLLESTYPRRQG